MLLDFSVRLFYDIKIKLNKDGVKYVGVAQLVRA